MLLHRKVGLTGWWWNISIISDSVSIRTAPLLASTISPKFVKATAPGAFGLAWNASKT